MTKCTGVSKPNCNDPCVWVHAKGCYNKKNPRLSALKKEAAEKLAAKKTKAVKAKTVAVKTKAASKKTKTAAKKGLTSSEQEKLRDVINKAVHKAFYGEKKTKTKKTEGDRLKAEYRQKTKDNMRIKKNKEGAAEEAVASYKLKYGPRKQPPGKPAAANTSSSEESTSSYDKTFLIRNGPRKQPPKKKDPKTKTKTKTTKTVARPKSEDRTTSSDRRNIQQRLAMWDLFAENNKKIRYIEYTPEEWRGKVSFTKPDDMEHIRVTALRNIVKHHMEKKMNIDVKRYTFFTPLFYVKDSDLFFFVVRVPSEKKGRYDYVAAEFKLNKNKGQQITMTNDFPVIVHEKTLGEMKDKKTGAYDLTQIYPELLAMYKKFYMWRD